MGVSRTSYDISFQRRRVPMVFKMRVRRRWIVVEHIVQDRVVVLMDSLVQLIPIVAVVCATVIAVKVSFCDGSKSNKL